MFPGTLAGENGYPILCGGIYPHQFGEGLRHGLAAGGTPGYFGASFSYRSGICVTAGEAAGAAVGTGKYLTDLCYQGIHLYRKNFLKNPSKRPTVKARIRAKWQLSILYSWQHSLFNETGKPMNAMDRRDVATKSTGVPSGKPGSDWFNTVPYSPQEEHGQHEARGYAKGINQGFGEVVPLADVVKGYRQDGTVCGNQGEVDTH